MSAGYSIRLVCYCIVMILHQIEETVSSYHPLRVDSVKIGGLASMKMFLSKPKGLESAFRAFHFHLRTFRFGRIG